MTKSIVSVLGALLSLACGVISFLSFETFGAELSVILAMLFGAISICYILYGIEDTKIADKLTDLFTEEDVSDE